MTVRIKELKIKADFTCEAKLHDDADDRKAIDTTSIHINDLADRISSMANHIKNRRER